MGGSLICDIRRNKFELRNMKNQNFEISECWNPSDRHFTVLESFQASFYLKQTTLNCLPRAKKSAFQKISKFSVRIAAKNIRKHARRGMPMLAKHVTDLLASRQGRASSCNVDYGAISRASGVRLWQIDRGDRFLPKIETFYVVYGQKQGLQACGIARFTFNSLIRFLADFILLTLSLPRSNFR